MDVDLNVLGPYAGLVKRSSFNFQGGSDSNSGTVTLTSSISVLTAPDRISKRANFVAIHKKKGIKFTQDSEARRQERAAEFQHSRKERRSQTLINNNRRPSMAALANGRGGFNEAIQEEDSINKSSNSSAMEVSGHECNTAPSPTVLDNKNQSANIMNNNANGMKNNINGAKPHTSAINGNAVGSNSRLAQQKKGPEPLKSLESRRDQLQKWKKEKEAIGLASRNNQKQPFKVGAATGAGTSKPASRSASAVSVTNSNTATTSSSARQPKVQSQSTRPLPATARGALPVTKTVTAAKPEETRRVTRAMAKTNPVTNGTSLSSAVGNGRGRVAVGGVQSTVQKMKNLNIADKPNNNATGLKHGESNTSTTRPLVKSKVGVTQPTSIKPSVADQKRQPISQRVPQNNNIQTQASAKNSKVVPNAQNKKTPSPPIKAASKSNNTPPKPKSRQNSTESISPKESHSPSHPVVEPKQAEAPKKKLKPKAIDTDYIDYNAKFSLACQKLNTYSKNWTGVLEKEPVSEEITDKIQGDIRSALGKVKLLLESKLPQFGQLLYSYLCQEMDPNPVLPCDLQGWWDVASIQLDAVDTIFEELTALKDNNWKEVIPPTITVQESNTSHVVTRPPLPRNQSEQEPYRPPRISKTASRAQASGGLKAFLANKRKMAQNGENKEEDGNGSNNAVLLVEEPSNRVKQAEPETTAPFPDKTFEGGFFTISSPKPNKTPQKVRRERKTHEVSHERIEDDDTVPSALTPVSTALSLPKTPNRRHSQRLSTTSEASLRRVSMCILNVRNSMGSLMKIGAVPISSEEGNNSTNDEHF